MHPPVRNTVPNPTSSPSDPVLGSGSWDWYSAVFTDSHPVEMVDIFITPSRHEKAALLPPPGGAGEMTFKEEASPSHNQAIGYRVGRELWPQLSSRSTERWRVRGLGMKGKDGRGKPTQEAQHTHPAGCRGRQGWRRTRICSGAWPVCSHMKNRGQQGLGRLSA